MSAVRKNANTKLVGQYFHSIKDGRVLWQGLVIGDIGDGKHYLVQLFEWLMGEPSIQRIVTIEEMRDWFFYDSAEQMIFSYEHGSAKRHRKEGA